MQLCLWMSCLTLVGSQKLTGDRLDQVGNQNKKLEDQLEDQPSWIAEITRQLHPQLEAYMESQVKETLEAKIGTTMSSVMNKVIGPFEFSTFNVSGLKMKMEKLRVLELNHESDHKQLKPIKMDISLSLHGPVEVGMALGMSNIYLTEVTIKVKARLTAAGPISRPPFISGIQMTLLEKPWIDFKFTGATKFLAKQMLHALDEVMETKLGYPNILAMPLKEDVDPRLIKSMNPTGVLAVNIMRARNLLMEEGFFKKLFNVASPDTYVRSQLGNAKFETQPILHNQHPVYGGEWIELPLDTLEGYSLDFSVYERSPTTDVVYGTAHLHDVKEAILNNSKQISLDISLSDEFKPADNASMGGGDLVVQMKWVPLELEVPGKHVNSDSQVKKDLKPLLRRRTRSLKNKTGASYPGQSARLAMIFIHNLTVTEMLAEKDMTASEEAKLELGKEGGLRPVGLLSQIPLTFVLNDANQTVAEIQMERLVLLGHNATKAALNFQMTSPNLDSSLDGQLLMEGPSDSLVTIPLQNQAKTVKIELKTHLSIRNLKQ